jgi:hypothetical protein
MNQNRLISARFVLGMLAALSVCGSSFATGDAKRTQATNLPPVEALLYTTMPSTRDHRPEMAMDGDEGTSYRSVGGMDDGDTFLVLLSRPISVQSIRVTTGDADGNDLLTQAAVETSSDGAVFVKAAPFSATGVASAALNNRLVTAIRIRMNAGTGVPKLAIREITIHSKTPISHIQYGPGRGFVDISQAPDLAGWAARAEREMESFWPDTAAMLYTYGFITPNMVNVVYKTGPNVTGVAATGGGVMTVNSKWCREHPDDTGLTVHETAHVVQSINAAAPGWLIEGTADYIRWVKFEPQHFHPRIDTRRATYHDAYQTSATFLGWCANHYDSQIVTKLNDAARAGSYKNSLFTKYCGKDVDTLWTEFVAAYKADPEHILQLPMPPAMVPRSLPTVTPGTCVPVDLSTAFDITGIVADGMPTPGNGGFDGEGSTYPAGLLRRSVSVKGVVFQIGAPGAPNVLASSGRPIALQAGNHRSLWVLASAIEGSHKDQDLSVTYTDGTTTHFAQNFSDWYVPEGFPGEIRAVKVDHRNTADGSRDSRTFYIYGYGFSLDPSKTVKSVTLPNESQIRVVAISLAD